MKPDRKNKEKMKINSLNETKVLQKIKQFDITIRIISEENNMKIGKKWNKRRKIEKEERTKV